MDAAITLDFPFVKDLPKREKSRIQQIWETFMELKRLTQEKGLVPAPLAAKILNISKQRVAQLIESKALESYEIDGHLYITEESLLKRARGEHGHAGRPRKLSVSDAHAASKEWLVEKKS